MLVKVFIKRTIQAGREMEIHKLLKEIRSEAMQHDGYISGESLVSTADPQDFLVISTWQSLEHWDSWFQSQIRKEIDGRLEQMQTEPTAYTSYVFSKHRLSVQTGFGAKP